MSLHDWIMQQGGPLPALIAAVAAYNVVISAVQKICLMLAGREPGWVQKAGKAGAALSGVLAANVAHPQKAPDPAVPAPVEKQL